MVLRELLRYFSEAIDHIDKSGSAFRDYQPGVGPYGEPQLLKLMVSYLRETYQDDFGEAKTKRTPDVLVPRHWATEAKIVRPFGDNGKEAESWSQNLLHPYPGNVSLIGDVYKLQELDVEEHKAIVAIGYEHTPPIISLDPLIESFERIALHVLRLPLGNRELIRLSGLIHPVHQQVSIYGWQIT